MPKCRVRRLEIDHLGLEKQDREILTMIIKRYNGGPVGAETLAISMGEGVDTLEDYYEPYLIQAGLLQRTPRGRMATALAYEHLKIPGGIVHGVQGERCVQGERGNENSGLLF
ncbi:hypothetical protein AGMMS4952_22870 [Spirochaetia bacterium]|nr:hypothetical protein AGMMS4952_22870 [Spirochaetia bacterium]